MTATAAAGGKMPKRLQTRLKMALPLVSGGSPKATAGSTGAAVVADTLRPHAAQKVSFSAKLLPQPAQNELKPFSLSSNLFEIAPRAVHSALPSCRQARIEPPESTLMTADSSEQNARTPV